MEEVELENIAEENIKSVELEDPELIIGLKKSKLLGRLTGLTCLLGFVTGFYNITQNLYLACYIDFIAGALIFISYVLNRAKYYFSAKLIFLSTLNLVYLLFCFSYPIKTGLYLLFIPAMTLASVLFGSQEKITNYIFLLLPLLGMIIVFNFSPSFISRVPLQEKEIMRALGVNLGISIALTGFALYWMVDLTSQTEKWLSDIVHKSINKNKELENANVELDKFIYRTTHDLRSPLASVKGLVMIASHETSDPNIQKFFKEIGSNIERLDSFTKEIIEYSKNALTEVILEPVDFHTLIDETIANLKYMKEAEKILFLCNIGIDEAVLIDKRRISIVLYNLIGNAIKYHDAKKEKQTIQIMVKRKGKELTLAVIDNGSGIAPEYLPKIFEMFYRATSSSSGSGLGLYIVKEAVEKMKGTITVETQYGIGSTFTVQMQTEDNLRATKESNIS